MTASAEHSGPAHLPVDRADTLNPEDPGQLSSKPHKGDQAATQLVCGTSSPGDGVGTDRLTRQIHGYPD